MDDNDFLSIEASIKRKIEEFSQMRDECRDSLIVCDEPIKKFGLEKKLKEIENRLRELNERLDSAQKQREEFEFPKLKSPVPVVLEEHYEELISLLYEGSLILVLGEGINLGEVPETQADPKITRPPTMREMTKQLAQITNYPQPTDHLNLARVAQRASLHNSRMFKKYLEYIFTKEYKPTYLHHIFAKLPRLLSEIGRPQKYPIVITTNYDTLLEQAFQEHREPYDLFSYYIGNNENNSYWLHRPAGYSGWEKVKDHNTFGFPPYYNLGAARQRHSIIIRLHGTLTKQLLATQGLVLTEDQFLSYLLGISNISKIPAVLMEDLQSSNLLFLGHKLQDWNMRIFLHHLVNKDNLTQGQTIGWAVDPSLEETDEKFWKEWRVDTLKLPLEDYVENLYQQLLNRKKVLDEQRSRRYSFG